MPRISAPIRRYSNALALGRNQAHPLKQGVRGPSEARTGAILLNDYKEQLRRIRKYTGKAFSPARGYSASKRPNFGQRMAVLKYSRLVDKLTTYDTVTYKPKRGEKTEVFKTTQQTGYRYFDTAIIQKINPKAKLKVTVDKSRPRGSRLVTFDTRKKIKQRQYFIDALPFLSAIQEADNNEDLAIEYIVDVLDRYAEDANFFMIKSGGAYIWGSQSGINLSKRPVAQKILALMNHYNDERMGVGNPSAFSTFFQGVTGWTDIQAPDAHIEIASKRKKEHDEQWHVKSQDRWSHTRVTNDGKLAQFVNSKFVGYVNMSEVYDFETKSFVPMDEMIELLKERKGKRVVKKKKGR